MCMREKNQLQTNRWTMFGWMFGGKTIDNNNNNNMLINGLKKNLLSFSVTGLANFGR